MHLLSSENFGRKRSDSCDQVHPRRERAVEWNAHHDALKGFRPINKSDPPAGKETPFVINIRSSFKMLSRVLLIAGLISSSRQTRRS